MQQQLYKQSHAIYSMQTASREREREQVGKSAYGGKAGGAGRQAQGGIQTSEMRPRARAHARSFVSPAFLGFIPNTNARGAAPAAASTVAH